jgi:DNA-binding NarL/FixJ family response regulator
VIRLLILDDHELVRGGLCRAFEAEGDFEVIAQAGTCKEGLDAARASEFDVAVVDLNLPDGSGVNVVRELRAASSALGIVVLTMFNSDEHLFQALESGASAFVTKSETTTELISAVRHAATSPNAFTATGLASAMHRRVAGSVDMRLTPRESEILELLKLGLPAHAIAAKLYVSPSTAKAHISKLYEKLGARNRTQAIMEAVRLRLITPAETDLAS